MNARLRVLVVDDHAVVRRGVIAYLEVLDDVEVAGEAADGAAALDVLADLQVHGWLPDVVLMDLQMPGMDGLEATRRIRADNSLSRVPIIALTALAMPGDRERCQAAGADDYLSKPVSLKALVNAIAAYVHLPAAAVEPVAL